MWTRFGLTGSDLNQLAADLEEKRDGAKALAEDLEDGGSTEALAMDLEDVERHRDSGS